MKKIYVVGTAYHYADFIKDATLVPNMEEADIVLFTGGEDVTPALYKEKALSCTSYNRDRDKAEMAEFNKIKSTQLAIGICRGSQLMCALNGGKLVQDCTNHGIASTHGITNGEMLYEITSTHHQMQYPYNLKDSEYTVLFKSLYNRSHYYKGGGIDPEKILEKGEPEIVLYHKEGLPKCLAIQGHPEYMRKDAPVVEMLNELIDETLKSL